MSEPLRYRLAVPALFTGAKLPALTAALLARPPRGRRRTMLAGASAPGL